MRQCENCTKALKSVFGRDETPRSREEVLGAFIFLIILILKRKMVIL